MIPCGRFGTSILPTDQIELAKAFGHFDIKRQLLLNCIYGVDQDYNAVEAAKFGLLLKLLEDEDTNSTNKTKPVLKYSQITDDV